MRKVTINDPHLHRMILEIYRQKSGLPQNWLTCLHMANSLPSTNCQFRNGRCPFTLMSWLMPSGWFKGESLRLQLLASAIFIAVISRALTRSHQTGHFMERPFQVAHGLQPVVRIILSPLPEVITFQWQNLSKMIFKVISIQINFNADSLDQTRP